MLVFSKKHKSYNFLKFLKEKHFKSFGASKYFGAEKFMTYLPVVKSI